jgi:hypothetical protein
MSVRYPKFSEGRQSKMIHNQPEQQTRNNQSRPPPGKCRNAATPGQSKRRPVQGRVLGRLRNSPGGTDETASMQNERIPSTTHISTGFERVIYQGTTKHQVKAASEKHVCVF